MLIKTLVLVMFCSAVNAGVILQYHHIGSDSPAITSTTLSEFEAHLDYLETHNMQVVSLSELIDQPTASKVAITFDDAYDNIFTNAYPILVKRGYPFTVFVATQFVGQNGFASWEQLQEMEQNGGLMANHTHSHLHMLRRLDNETTNQWLERLKQEILFADKLLKQHFEKPMPYLAYPYGEYDTHILDLVAELGFVGFGQQSGAVGTGTLKTLQPRFPLSGVYANPEAFSHKVSSVSLPIQLSHHSPLIDNNPPTLHLKFNETKGLRLDQLVCYGPGGPTLLEPRQDNEFVAFNKTELPIGRSRYNCTMPTAKGDHFHWFSQLWIRKNTDGSWYSEP